MGTETTGGNCSISRAASLFERTEGELLLAAGQVGGPEQNPAWTLQLPQAETQSAILPNVTFPTNFSFPVIVRRFFRFIRQAEQLSMTKPKATL
jgi:hypothetical protein